MAQDYTTLRTYFDKLATMILSFPRLARSSHFVFIPGPTDPGGDVVSILPKPPLAKVFTNTLRERIPNVHFTTNPARSHLKSSILSHAIFRIRYCGQDI